MENSREKNTREAIEKYGPITDRFILRLGKSEEEAGKFESWHSDPTTIEEDFQGFLACLSLTRLVDSVEERMKTQKAGIRAVKKEQRETAKALKKEQEKLQKAIDKAAAKLEKEKEKQRIKAEAKAVREAAKAAKKMGVTHRVEVNQTVNLASPADIAGSIPAAPTIFIQEAVTNALADNRLAGLPAPSAEAIAELEKICTSTSTQSVESGPLGSMLPLAMHKENVEMMGGSANLTTSAQEMPLPVSTTLTVEKAKPTLNYETETYVPKFNIPMEG